MKIYCNICGAEIERTGPAQKYCTSCAAEVDLENKRKRYEEQKSTIKPKANTFNSLTKEAKQKGMTYGQLQAKKYLERMQG